MGNTIHLQDRHGVPLTPHDLGRYSGYGAYLYDCDGTLADTMAPHKTAWMEEIKNRGFQLPATLIDELAGMPAVQTVEEMNRRYGWGLDPQVVAKSKEQLFLDQYAHLSFPIEIVVEHLKVMAANGKKIGVVSGGRTRVVKHTLESLGVMAWVGVVICAEDVKIGKPHPEPFLMAAEKLGVAPQDCLVFEDADFGVQSARSAGMDWIRVVHA